MASWGDTPMVTISSNWTEDLRSFKGKLLVAAMFGLQGCGCSEILPTDPGLKVFWPKSIICTLCRDMADQELRELLTEFQNLAESEHHSFISTIVNNFNYSNTIFAALILFEVRKTAHHWFQLIKSTFITQPINFSDQIQVFILGPTKTGRPAAAPLWSPFQCL